MKRVYPIPFLVFAVFALSIHLVLPQFFAWQKVKNDFAQRERDLANRQTYYQKLNETLQEVAGYEDTLQKIQTTLPGEVSLAALIAFFDKKASDNGLVLKAVSPFQVAQLEGVEENQNLPAQYFTVALDGDILAFENFLKDIETSARLIDAQSFSFLRQEAGQKVSGQPGISFVAKVYY